MTTKINYHVKQHPILVLALVLILGLSVSPVIKAKPIDEFQFKFLLKGKETALNQSSNEWSVVEALSRQRRVTGIRTQDTRYKKYNNLNITDEAKLLGAQVWLKSETGEQVIYTDPDEINEWNKSKTFKFSLGTYIVTHYRKLYPNQGYMVTASINFENFVESLPYVDIHTKLVALNDTAMTVKYMSILEREAKKAKLSLDAYVKKVNTDKSTRDALLKCDISDWAKPELTKLISHEIILEDDFITLYQKPIERHQFAYLVIRFYEKMKGPIESTATAFDDLNWTAYKSEIEKAYKIGIVTGVNKDTFYPAGPITRQEVCLMLYRALKAADSSITVPTKELQNADKNEVDAWAKDGVTYIVSEGIMKGIDGKIAPKENMTVEQALALVNRLAIAKGLYK